MKKLGMTFVLAFAMVAYIGAIDAQASGSKKAKDPHAGHNHGAKVTQAADAAAECCGTDGKCCKDEKAECPEGCTKECCAKKEKAGSGSKAKKDCCGTDGKCCK